MTTTKGACQESLTKQIIVEPRTTNTQQNQQTAFIKKFILYPNPNNGIFKTKVELNQKAPISIQIINLNANIVNTITLKENTKEHIIHHNLSKKPGTYIILLKTPKGYASKKIVVL